MPPAIDKGNILAEFRRQVEDEGILKPGDTVGTDDQTLLYGYFLLLQGLCLFISYKEDFYGRANLT